MKINGRRGFSLLEVLIGISLGGSLLLGGFAIAINAMRVCLDNYGSEALHEITREYLYLALRKDFEESSYAYATRGLIERNGKPFRELAITPLLASRLGDIENSHIFFEDLKAVGGYSINNEATEKVCHSLLLLGSTGEVKGLYEIISEEVSTGLQHTALRFANMGEQFLSRTDGINIHAKGKYNLKNPDQVIPRVEEKNGYILALFPTGYGASRLSSIGEEESSLLVHYLPGSMIFRAPYFNYKR